MRSALFPDGVVQAHESLDTLYKVFEHSVEKYAHKAFLGVREKLVDPKSGAVSHGKYVFKTYAEVGELANSVGDGLAHFFKDTLKLKYTGQNVGIYAVNRPEWIIAEYAAYRHSNVIVALYDTLGANAIEYILNHSSISVVFASADKIPILLHVAKRCPKVRGLVCLDPIESKVGTAGSILRAWSKDCGLELIGLNELAELGRKHKLNANKPSPNSTAVISYTSGTTGDPKGVIQTHCNIASVVYAARIQGISFASEDVYASYLPLAHVFEHSVFTIMLACGTSVGYWRGDVALLVEDMQTLRPTVFPSVPRLFNRIYAKVVQSTLESGSTIKAALFRRALNSKMESLKSSKTIHSTLWDPLVFNKVKAVLGGRVRVMVSASAPVSPEVLQFFRVVFCTDVLEAYGQTEGAGACNVTWLGCFDTGNVGPPVSCCEVKLISAPEMGYSVDDKPLPRGEICVRGTSIFQGYFRDEEKTRETFLADGWMKTGDIGSLDKRGRISVIDRRKNIFKLSQGEYVAPEKLENVFAKNQFIAQIYVHGDSDQDSLVAVVVPNPENAVLWAKKSGLLPQSVPDPSPTDLNPEGYKDACSSAQLKEHILLQLRLRAKEAKLQGFEYVKDIQLDYEQFSVENGLLTPTLKLKRSEALKKYREQLKVLYERMRQQKSLAADAAKL